jgi:hypothetical protein
LAGKVEYIGVNSPHDEVSELGAIKEPQQVAALVAMVLAAPVDQNRRDHDETMYFIEFHFEDGTTKTRVLAEVRRALSRDYTSRGVSYRCGASVEEVIPDTEATTALLYRIPLRPGCMLITRRRTLTRVEKNCTSATASGS